MIPDSPDPNVPDRRQRALANRIAAAQLAASRPIPEHIANGDERAFGDDNPQPTFAFSFTKGLPHDPHTGLVADPDDFVKFREAIASGDLRDFRNVPLGHPDAKGDCPPQACIQPKASPVPPNLNSRKLASDTRAFGLFLLEERLVEQGGVRRSGKPRDASDDERVKQLQGRGSGEPCATKPKNGKVGIGLRAWESMSAGLAFDLQGPDAQAVTMPPAPGVSDADPGVLTAEIAEVYAQALLRDVPLEVFDNPNASRTRSPLTKSEHGYTASQVIDALNDVQKATGGFDERVLMYEPIPGSTGGHYVSSTVGNPTPKTAGAFTEQTVFRGAAPGDHVGPYLSQFMLLGNPGITGFDCDAFLRADGRIRYGGITVDQRVRIAREFMDYMTTWEEWFAVQCAANVRGFEVYEPNPRLKPKTDNVSSNAGYRLIQTGRDLSTYVHYDALYEAYLNACLYLLAEGAPTDPGIPFRGRDEIDHQEGFAHFGGPHILSLVTEVATRALKAVRYQKFNVHRRPRPELMAARIDRFHRLPSGLQESTGAIREVLEDSGILELVRIRNARNNASIGRDHCDSYLLPMAFPEGSPMHASYGAGHATVAGACVTVLKAFFDGSQPLPGDPTGCGLTVEGELNKLAANISIGRDWAGVHFYSDYLESIRMGERIAIGMLQEQKLNFREDFTMRLNTFDGVPVGI